MVNSKLLHKLDAFQAKLPSLINFFKFKYYRKTPQKWSDPSTSPKCYWTLFHENEFIADFNEKSEIFNSFAKQCSIIDNGSALPSPFPLITEKSLSNVGFLVEDIKNITTKLDSNKAHGYDMFSIRMLKICDESICKPLIIIFKSCLTQSIFPFECKKANVVLILKKLQAVY